MNIILKYSDKNIKGIFSQYILVAVILGLAWIIKNEKEPKVSTSRYKTK